MTNSLLKIKKMIFLQDIAVLTNRQDLCSYYRENSQNVKSRFACSFDSQTVLVQANNLGIILPNNQEACAVKIYIFVLISFTF